jgi:hypothetical protein
MNNHFRKRSIGPRLAPLEAARQGRISQMAFLQLGRDDALAFLNDANESLGGRPIDLAIQSEEGFRSVEEALTLIGKR